MNAIKAIIVDDEARARRVLFNLINKSTANIEVVAECSDLENAVLQIKLLSPEVVFLDIEMPNYAGYEIVNFFDKIDFEIIFVTAYNDYALKAFELCAIDYLVKPIDRERLSNALRKLDSRLEEKNKLEQFKTLMNTIKSKELNKIVIPEIGNRRIFDLEDLIAIEADGSYSKLYSKNSNAIIVSKNLKYFENALPKNSNFFRSHRGWIVNLKYIRKINKTEGVLYLESNIKAKLSRSNYLEFEAAIS